MTRMIDLLEEYMHHRKHTYIRLDGSSKIHERRGESLFRNKRFALNKMFQRNASKFAIFYVSENPCTFFRFSFRANLYFYLMNALVYVDIDQSIHKVKI